MTTPPSGRTRQQAGAGAAVGLGLVGVLALGYGFASQEGEPPGPQRSGHHGGHGAAAAPSPAPPTIAPSPAAVPAKAPRPAGESYDTAVGPLMSASRPVTVRIPSLDVASDVIELGLQEDRRMEVPDNGQETGWYTGAPMPGELGPAILAAHVTWKKKPAVFFELGALRPGQRIEVDRADGRTAVFQVTRVGQYPKADFPSDEVYGSVNHAALRVITCGGVLDGETGHHVDNVVVYAKLVAAAG